VFEVLRGISTATRRADAALLFTLVPALPLTADAATVASQLDQQLRRRGEIVGEIDVLIAAIALIAGRALLTHNRRHFQRIPGLVLATI
jgi:tRNA(fMet)-specific endonuclease VapC